MRSTTYLACATALSILALAPAGAAEPAAPRLWHLHSEAVKPGMMAEYETTSREFFAAVRTHAKLLPHFRITAAMQGEDGVFGYALPLDSFADLDRVNAELEALGRTMGPAFGELLRRNGETLDHVDEMVVMERPDLSYYPQSERLRPEEKRYFRFDFYYLLPGSETAADALAAEFVQLWTAKGVRNGYRFYKGVVGADLPLLFVVSGARDPADYAAAEASDLALLGDGAKALFERAAKLSRRIEFRRAWLRPDLTVAPAP